MTIITYQQVFQVSNVGDELSEARGLTYTPCPAVTAQRKFLTAHPFLGGNKVQGTGPLYRPWDRNSHEFNRHHAGLAVDIMLDQKINAEVALGQQLVLLFRRNVAVMKWRSIIYQNVTFGPGGGATDGGGHMDHIHIDWHDTNRVQWKNGISSVPLRKNSGEVIQCPLVQGNKVASSIEWPPEASTDFSSDTTIPSELADLMGKNDRGELSKIPWTAAAFTGKTAMNAVQNLKGKWLVSIGDWNGAFYFDANGGVSWADDDWSPKHRGGWSVNGNRLEWKFRDAGDFRTFTVELPLRTYGANGTIFPAGQGWFTMSKATIGAWA
jgi:hypothetical protein